MSHVVMALSLPADSNFELSAVMAMTWPHSGQVACFHFDCGIENAVSLAARPIIPNELEQPSMTAVIGILR